MPKANTLGIFSISNSLQTFRQSWNLVTTNKLFAAWNFETFVEQINTTTGCNITLFTSIEWVAFITNVQVQVVTCCGVDFHNVTARTRRSNFFVFRVNIFFHGKPLLRPCRHSALSRTPHVVLIEIKDLVFYVPKGADHTEYQRNAQ